LEQHPDYSTAYIIYALAKAYSGDEHHAIEALDKASSLLGDESSFKFYKNKILKIIAERNSLSEAKRPAFTDIKEQVVEENTFFNLEDGLDKLAEELSKAKIKISINEQINEDTPIPEYTGKKISSETLAKIYVSQKNYNKAIEVYKDLIALYPDKENYFTQKIVDIETLI